LKIFVYIERKQHVSSLLAPHWLCASTSLTRITFSREEAALLTVPTEKDKEMYLWGPSLG